MMDGVYHSMGRPFPRQLTFAAALFAAVPAMATRAQQPPAPQPMGVVATADALVTGGLEVQGSRARLVSNASVTAYDHPAAIELARGGDVLVCATSQLHLLHSGTGQALLFGLDRGALEIHSPTDVQDVILTPDIRFTVEQLGALDLRLRVTRDGDTCVENAGARAPVLMLSDAFSQASYRLLPGQHVLFEHGSLREVVDNERSPCGCPTPAPARNAAEAAHPFPAAISEGLAAPPASANAAPPGEKHTQVTETLSYGAGQPPPPALTDTSIPAATTSTAPPPTPPGAHDLIHALGRFFHKLFTPGPPPADATPAN